MKKDKEFKKRYDEEKERRIKQQGICHKCKEPAEEKYMVLHHTKSEEKAKEFPLFVDEIKKEFLKGKKSFSNLVDLVNKEKQKYIDYYKSLEEVELEHSRCHMKEHDSLIKSNYHNSYISKLNKAINEGNIERINQLKKEYFDEATKRDLYDKENYDCFIRVADEFIQDSLIEK